MFSRSAGPLAGTRPAHHSIQAQFDINKSFTIAGNVAKVEWINPHSYLTLNVKDADGKVEKWAFEMGAAGQLRRTGLSRADRGGLKAGDAVTIKALAARDGSNSGLLQEIRRRVQTPPDGAEAQQSNGKVLMRLRDPGIPPVLRLCLCPAVGGAGAPAMRTPTRCPGWRHAPHGRRLTDLTGVWNGLMTTEWCLIRSPITASIERPRRRDFKRPDDCLFPEHHRS